MDVIASEAKQSQLFKGWRLPRPLPAYAGTSLHLRKQVWPRNDNSSNYVRQTTKLLSCPVPGSCPICQDAIIIE